jgi:hypothetical protein
MWYKHSDKFSSKEDYMRFGLILAILLISLGLQATGMPPQRCADKFGTAVAEETQISSPIWGKTTDPTKHDPNKFRYLVHGFEFVDDDLDDSTRRSLKMRGVLLFNLDKLNELPSVSASLIDNKHQGTWGYGGLILEAMNENIVRANVTDNGSRNSHLESIQQMQTALPSSDSLMRLSYGRHGSYNEVLLKTGSTTGKNLKITGFFVKMLEIDGVHEPVDKKLYEILKEYSDELNLPLISLEQLQCL